MIASGHSLQVDGLAHVTHHVTCQVTHHVSCHMTHQVTHHVTCHVTNHVTRHVTYVTHHVTHYVTHHVNNHAAHPVTQQYKCSKESPTTEATEAHFLIQKSSLPNRFQVCDPTGFQYHLTELHLTS